MKELPHKIRSRFAERQPLFWAAMAFALGILVETYLIQPRLSYLPTIRFGIAIAAMIVIAYFARHTAMISRAAGLCAVLIAAMLIVGLRSNADPGAVILPYANRQVVMVVGRVVREGDWEADGPTEARQLIDLETEEVIVDGEAHAIKSGVRLAVYSEAETNVPPFQYGQRLQFSTKLSPPHNFRDPGVFDYKEYLAENGIEVLGSTKLAELAILPGFSGSHLQQWRARAHRSVLQKIASLWRPAEANLLDAMLVGDESFVGHESRTEFQRTGTYHLLVVSGMNVGILAFVMFWAFRRLLRMNDVAASILTILATAAYAFLTYVGPPVWRATLMLALFLGARLLYRQRSTLNAIGIAALGVLLVDPHALIGASFQMTFLCVVVIAGIGIPLLERTSQPYARGLRQLDTLACDRTASPKIAQFRLDLRMIVQRIGRFVGDKTARHTLVAFGRCLIASAEVLFISLLMQLGMALPMAYYFHRVTVAALPANILVLPLTEIMMPAAVGAVGLSYVWHLLAAAPAWVAGRALDAITGTIHILGGLSVADLRVPTPALAAILFTGCALALAIFFSRRRTSLAAAGLLLLAGSAWWIAKIPPHAELAPHVLEVTAIDVGQGDSLFLACPDGRTILVDAGGLPQWMHSQFDIGEEVVSPYLWSRGVSRLDAVEVTHGHADHIGGMFAVVANFRPRELWIAANSSTPEMDALVHEAQKLGVRVVEHKSGDALGFGGTAIRFLAPDGETFVGKRKENEASLVMKITYQGTSALLEGDAEKRAEKEVAKEEPQADLLKVAHHGSATSTIPELLAAVRPRFAVISVGANNVYGHPREEVLERLAQAQVKTFRTDLDGAVTFYLDGKGVTPQTFVPQ